MQDEEPTAQYWCVLVAQSCEGCRSCRGVKCWELSSDRTLPAPAGAALAAGGLGHSGPAQAAVVEGVWAVLVSCLQL